MKKKFIVADSIALQGKEFYYDLHNSYVVQSIVFDELRKTLELTLQKMDGSWVNIDDPKTIRLVFSNVLLLNSNETPLDQLPDQVDEIGYKEVDDIDYDWLLSEAQSSSDDHMIFRFIDDSILRIFSESVELHT